MSGPRTARVVELSFAARAELTTLWRRTTVAAGLARRVRVILRAADGVPLAQIARELQLDRNAVRTWIDRYRAAGLAGLQDRPRSGRPRSFSPCGGVPADPPGLRATGPGGAVAEPVGLR